MYLVTVFFSAGANVCILIQYRYKKKHLIFASVMLYNHSFDNCNKENNKYIILQFKFMPLRLLDMIWQLRHDMAIQSKNTIPKKI